MTPGRRSILAAIGVGVVLFGWWGYGLLKKPPVPAAPPYAFDMCILHTPNAPPTTIAWNDAVLSSVARTLTTEERTGLEGALGDAAVRWEAKANPLLEDLEGGDPDAPLVAWFKKGPTFLRTAQASSKLRACTPEGFCVLPRPKNGPCPPDSAPPASADEDDRARFIQWPWGHALRFHAATPDAASAAAASLREQVRNSHSIAVVMAAEDGDVTKKDPFTTLRERWTKVAGLKRAARRSKTAQDADQGFVVDLGASDVIVLPRHDAMTAKSPDATMAADVSKAAPALVTR